MLAISDIQEFYALLSGRKYCLLSLPERDALERLREAKKKIVGPQHDIEWFDRVSERLRDAL